MIKETILKITLAGLMHDVGKFDCGLKCVSVSETKEIKMKRY